MQSLAKRASQGDGDAFVELMEENSTSMYKVARGILKGDADVADAVQETILTCFEKIHTLKEPKYFKTWMIRILINVCNQILRKNGREVLPGEMPEEVLTDASLAEFEFKEMLSLVEENYRLILVLYYVEGFKVWEIGELLGIKENTVKTRLARAREQIKAEYRGNGKKQKKQEILGVQGGSLDERAGQYKYASVGRYGF